MNDLTPEQLRDLANEVANAPQGRDTLGSAGFVLHLTAAKRDAIVLALIQMYCFAEAGDD